MSSQEVLKEDLGLDLDRSGHDYPTAFINPDVLKPAASSQVPKNEQMSLFHTGERGMEVGHVALANMRAMLTDAKRISRV